MRIWLNKKIKRKCSKTFEKFDKKVAQGNDTRQCRTEKHSKYTPDDNFEYSDMYSLNQLSVHAYERSPGI